MDEQLKVVRVGWYSLMDLPQLGNLTLNCTWIEVDAASVPQKNFDVLVLDINRCETLEQIQHQYMTIGLPTLVVVDTIEQESAVLFWLAVGDDTCKRDAINEQIGLRLQRILRYREQKQSLNLDKLTGVANFQKFKDYAMRLLVSKEDSEPVCLIYLDIDRFKFINDRYGHGAGDKILQSIGQILQQYALGAGIVARTGGDKFAICVRGNIEQGKAFAEFIKTQLHAYEFQVDDVSCVHLTVCLAVVPMGEQTSIEELWEDINQCIYAAKKQGRNQVVTTEEFNAIADAAGQDKLITDFEHRIRVTAERMVSEMVLKATRLAKKYRAEAEHDGLTEVFNRRYLDRLLPREIEKALKYQQRLTVLLLDLDNFGAVNRNYGFPTGDQALRIAAKVLRNNVRAVDWVTRYGGEEFCIVMADTDLNTGCQIAERIRLALSKEIVTAYNGQQFHVTASIGVVEMIPDNDPVSLLQRASDKVRESKNNGRNQIRF